ncbi:MAG: hypothetical protein AAB696_00265 [Patescibacteria group bacterium]
MEENLNQQKSSISASPEPGITIRTMDSDVKAIKQGGGEMIAPQFVNREELKTETGFNIPGYTGPEKAIFAPAATIAEADLGSAEEESSTEKSGKWKFIAIIIVILAIAIFFGFLGYSIIFPWLFSKEMPIAQ